MRTTRLFFRCALYLLLTFPVAVHSQTGVSVPISAETGTSIAGDLFPFTVKLSRSNLFLTNPVLLFLDSERVGLQVRFQAYDYRPEAGIAISESGRAMMSGKIDFDTGPGEILLYDPRVDTLEFDRASALTERLSSEITAAWSAQVTNPIRSPLPPHPYLLPFKRNIRDLSYDGKNITLVIRYQ